MREIRIELDEMAIWALIWSLFLIGSLRIASHVLRDIRLKRYVPVPLPSLSNLYLWTNQHTPNTWNFFLLSCSSCERGRYGHEWNVRSALQALLTITKKKKQLQPSSSCHMWQCWDIQQREASPCPHSFTFKSTWFHLSSVKTSLHPEKFCKLPSSPPDTHTLHRPQYTQTYHKRYKARHKHNCGASTFRYYCIIANTAWAAQRKTLPRTSSTHQRSPPNAQSASRAQ